MHNGLDNFHVVVINCTDVKPCDLFCVEQVCFRNITIFSKII